MVVYNSDVISALPPEYFDGGTHLVLKKLGRRGELGYSALVHHENLVAVHD